MSNEPITLWAPDTIKQSTRERLIELIRTGGIKWNRENNLSWRDNPWKDGILVDLDEQRVLETLADHIIAHANPEATV